MSGPTVTVLHFHAIEPQTSTMDLAGQAIQVRQEGCDGDLERLEARIAELDGQTGR